MADAAGLNSFVRQIGGSVGLTIFATLFTNYAVEATARCRSHVTLLRPEVVTQMARTQSWLLAHGIAPSRGQLEAGQMLGHR